MRYSFYDNPAYKLKQASLTKGAWQRGIFNSKIKPLQSRICQNYFCKKTFFEKPYEPKQYCSSNCAAKINNLRRSKLKIHKRCIICDNSIARSSIKYCSNKCQNRDTYIHFLQKWKTGEVDGNIGIKTKIISGHLRKYLLEKYQNQCSLCGWNQKHPLTNKVPLEINHIDGNADNNLEENLEILCPNCHSLTPNFRNLNKGHGRKWRLINSKIR